MGSANDRHSQQRWPTGMTTEMPAKTVVYDVETGPVEDIAPGLSTAQPIQTAVALPGLPTIAEIETVHAMLLMQEWPNPLSTFANLAEPINTVSDQAKPVDTVKPENVSTDGVGMLGNKTLIVETTSIKE